MLWSLDARSGGQPRPLPLVDVGSSGGIYLDGRNKTSMGAIPIGGHSKLGKINYIDDGHSMRAVKGSLGHSIRRGGVKYKQTWREDW